MSCLGVLEAILLADQPRLTRLYLVMSQVYVAARSEEKARAAIEDLIRDTGKNNIHYLQLDLGDLPQVKKAADEFKSYVYGPDYREKRHGISELTYLSPNR